MEYAERVYAMRACLHEFHAEELYDRQVPVCKKCRTFIRDDGTYSYEPQLREYIHQGWISRLLDKLFQ